MTYTQLPENAPDLFKQFVAAFKPTPYNAAKKDITTNPDTIIGVRIRPLFPVEVEANDAYAVLPCPRSENGQKAWAENVVDLHELKMSVRGPKLDVSC